MKPTEDGTNGQCNQFDAINSIEKLILLQVLLLLFTFLET